MEAPQTETLPNSTSSANKEALRAILRKSRALAAEKLPLSPADQLLLKENLMALLKEADLTLSFTNAGIPYGSSFADETFRILKGKILPYLHGPNDFETALHEICDKKNDYKLIIFFAEALPAFAANLTDEEKSMLLNEFRLQARKATEIVSYRIAALGMNEEIAIRAGREEALITPFLEQNREVNKLLTDLENKDAENAAGDLAHARVMIKQCYDNIAVIDKGAEKNGASLHQTFILRKLYLLCDRLLLLLPIAYGGETEEALGSFIVLFQKIILAETNPSSLRAFISSNLNLIAFRITENKRKTGEHYVAADKAGYSELFVSACGGGFIVSLMVVMKVLLHKMELPLLWETLFFGINYALGFALIHMLGFTLATKQPAMTAAFIAASMDDIKDDTTKYHHLAATIATVSRSQVISILGNLVVVFPLALFWAFVMNKFSSGAFLDASAGAVLLNSSNPFVTLSLWYAAITGVLLFLAGIISGFGDNKVVVSRIGARIEAHPWLKRNMRPERLHKFALYIEKNLGPLLGNIAFGFMLAFTTFAGKITGLPIDIRHITFSTGNFSLGLLGTGFSATWPVIAAVLLGVFLIGIMNLAVSFLLALQVAARSRGLRLKDYPDMLLEVGRYFKAHPTEFFFPPK